MVKVSVMGDLTVTGEIKLHNGATAEMLDDLSTSIGAFEIRDLKGKLIATVSPTDHYFDSITCENIEAAEERKEAC